MERPVAKRREPAGYGALPTKPQDQSDTEPEPFGPVGSEFVLRTVASRDDTAKRCYMCGRGDGEYRAGTVDGARRVLLALRQAMAESGYRPDVIDRLLARTETALTWLY